MTMQKRFIYAMASAVALACLPRQAAAQLDPLLFIKNKQPNIIIMVDTANRMQRDHNNDYRDDNVYKRVGGGSEAFEIALGVADANSSAAGTGTYRRKYVGLVNTDNGAGSDKFETDHIEIVGDRDATFADFDKRTRMSLARQALTEVINRNTGVARFGLMRTRQSSPHFETPASSNATRWLVNVSPVRVTSNDAAWAAQKVDTDDAGNKWMITRPVVSGSNGSVAGPVGPLVAADAASANTSVLNILALATGATNSLLPAGNDNGTTVDAPVDLMLTDVKTEAARLINADTQCRNTLAILVVGGSRGGSSSGDPAAIAATFNNVAANHRVPVHVIAIAPPAGTDETQLQNIATNSGGRYTKITAAMVDATKAGDPVPEVVHALNKAVQHGFSAQGDCDANKQTEHQITSPIVGTVNIENASDIGGTPLPLTVIHENDDPAKPKIPQRSNLMVTSAFSLGGLEARLRAFRLFKPAVDATKPLGYKFVNDGTRLWIACAPGAPGDVPDTPYTSPCASLMTSERNVYTSLPDGTVTAFTTANATTLRPYLNAATDAEASALITFIRSQPLGAVVSSTPAIMDPPSLDPPPDADYPGFVDVNKGRRTLLWVGANDGMLHAIDGRLGIEVWAFIPFNLLPKLYALRSGQPVGDFRYFVDGSPKIADVKIDGVWRSYLVMGEGAGGTFYQTFDVTLDDMAATVAADANNIGTTLTYFSNATSVPLKWAFPKYSDFDVSVRLANQGATDPPFGDIALGASTVSKTVGQTWSDPAIGQIESVAGKFAVLAGSGFLRYSREQQANRGGTVAGTTFYLLDAKTGDVFDSRSVGSDAVAENVDDCATANDCRKIKNALQADPVATGPPDSRFITKAYIGDLDGRIWRYDFKLDAALVPKINAAPTKLYDAGAAHPMFTSMASVNVGGTQQYLFQGTGSDLLASNQVSQQYKLLVILDNGTSGSKTAEIALTSTDGAGDDEKVSAFPAVAGDIVFFATTSFKPATPCTAPNANLYAFTFIGGPAYDTNASGTLTAADSTRVRTTTGARASAPFIVDQHLAFATGNKIEMFGDPQDYNNGVGQAGVRILSWREVR